MLKEQGGYPVGDMHLAYGNMDLQLRLQLRVMNLRVDWKEVIAEVPGLDKINSIYYIEWEGKYSSRLCVKGDESGKNELRQLNK